MPARHQTGEKTELYRFAGVGLQFAATIGVFALLGYWVDGLVGTGPWLLLVGVFLGFGLGLVSLIFKFQPSNAPEREPSRSQSPDNDEPR